MGFAEASLIGDEITLRGADENGDGFAFATFTVVDGLDANTVHEGVFISFDIGEKDIWIKYDRGSTTLLALSYWFTDLDWRDDSGNLIQGKITDVTCAGDLINVLDFGDHEVHLEIDSITVNVGDVFDFHCELTTDHEQVGGGAVGGKMIPIDTTSLLLAYGELNSWWMTPIAIGFGLGLYLIKKRI